jgi:hypothetical protein
MCAAFGERRAAYSTSVTSWRTLYGSTYDPATLRHGPYRPGTMPRCPTKSLTGERDLVGTRGEGDGWGCEHAGSADGG